MQIARLVGKKSRVVFQLRDDDGGMLANFDSLAAAGAVLRYLTGGNMNDDERQRAYLAMALVDSEQAAKVVKRSKMAL